MPDVVQTSQSEPDAAPPPASRAAENQASSASASRAPSADALDASVRLARLRRQMFARVEAPRIAQYHVLRQIGGGGMGLVFAAWDPSLDRVVAIKVLRDPWSPQAGTQLRREAMALARLRHPNVVSVFEVGEHEGQVYIAMEFVEGKTLRQWMKEWRESLPRDLSRVIDVFVQAAQGLAAAHGRRVVHRDVKPENTMIEAEGRVRLMDFGLAGREVVDDVTEGPEGKVEPDAPVTRSAFGLVGTPAYMAPEQFAGESPGPEADQFSLCACLFETLYGRRIRKGHTLEAVAATADAPIELPGDGGVPGRLESILRRGLAVDPQDRFGSMDALADALLSVERHRRRRWIAAGAFALATGGVLAGLAVASGGEEACTGAAANLEGVWGDSTADELEERFADESASFVPAAWAATRGQLDEYAQAWIEQHTDACEDAQVRRETSTEVMDLRMACLRDRRRHLGALVEVLREGQLEALSRAPDSIAKLPPIERCADADYVTRQGFRREDSEVSALVADMLARATALHHAGDTVASHDAAAGALAAAQESEDGAGIARARFELGRNQNRMGQHAEARDTLISAYEEARRAGLPDIASRTAVSLVRVTAVDLSRFEEGEWWLRMADLEAEPVDTTHSKMDRDVAGVALLQAAGRPEEARVRAESALNAADEMESQDPRAAAMTRLQVAQFMLLSGERHRAEALIERGRVALEAQFGPDHPINVIALKPLCLAARLRGDVPTGIEYARRAVALRASSVGSRSLELAGLLDTLALSLSHGGHIEEADAVTQRALDLDDPHPLGELMRGRLLGRRSELWRNGDNAKSLRYAEEAYALTRQALGEQHRKTVLARVALGAALGENGRRDEARETMESALVAGQAALGASHPDVGTIHHQLGREYARVGDWEPATRHYEQSTALLAAAFGRDSYSLAAPLANLCGGLVQLQRAEEALPSCEHALALAEDAIDASPHVMPQLHNNLGAALLGLERYDEGRAHLAQAIALWPAAKGEGSFEEAMAVNNMAEAWELEGSCHKALPLYRRSLAMREAKFGPDHPATKTPREGIARCQPGAKTGPAAGQSPPQ